MRQFICRLLTEVCKLNQRRLQGQCQTTKETTTRVGENKTVLLMTRQWTACTGRINHRPFLPLMLSALDRLPPFSSAIEGCRRRRR